MADLKVKLYNFEGKELGNQDLNAAFFGVKVNPIVVQQVVIAQNANSREAIAHTKGRAEVRGGGRKPWKQKGTGRARHGSIRSPLWIGGGVTFGPSSERNFAQKVNKKVKKQALAMAFSDKIAESRLVLVDGYNLADAKTKTLANALKNLPNNKQSTLIVTAKAEDNIVKASKNIPKVKAIYFGSLNIVDLLKYKYILVNQDLLSKIEKHYS